MEWRIEGKTGFEERSENGDEVKGGSLQSQRSFEQFAGMEKNPTFQIILESVVELGVFRYFV